MSVKKIRLTILHWYRSFNDPNAFYKMKITFNKKYNKLIFIIFDDSYNQHATKIIGYVYVNNNHKMYDLCKISVDREDVVFIKCLKYEDFYDYKMILCKVCRFINGDEY